MLHKYGSPDDTSVRKLQHGFPVVGQLDYCGHETNGKAPRPVEITVDELAATRQDFNKVVLRNLRDSDPPGVTYDETWEDVKYKSMTMPVPLTSQHVRDFHLSRRFAVSQWSVRKQTWKHRTVDHLSESGINAATNPFDSNSTQSIDWQTWQILLILSFGFVPSQ